MASTAHRERVAAELKRLREACGESGPAVALALGEGWSQSKVSRIENGKISVGIADLTALLNFYSAPEDVKVELLTMTAEDLGLDGAWVIRAGNTPRRLGEVAAIETRVRRIRQFHPLMVPSQLQAPAYTEAVAQAGRFDNPAGIVARRVKRQELLTQQDSPEYIALLDARALEYWPGGRKVLLQQLDFLRQRAKLPAVTLRIIPLGIDRGVAAMTPYIIYDFKAPTSPPVVLVEAQTADLYLSSQDDVDSYSDLFDRLSEESLDHDASLDYLVSLSRDVEKHKSSRPL